MSVRAADITWIPTVSARLYRPIALALEARGLSSDALFAEFGAPSPASAGWDVRLPLPQIAGLWGRLLEVTGERYFSFRAAEHVDLTTCDVITFLESAASTLRVAPFSLPRVARSVTRSASPPRTHGTTRASGG